MSDPARTIDVPPRVLAVITARGGSRGVPRKNICLVGGRPLIEWSIVAARQAESVGRVVVSTDSEEIAVIARGCGAEVPWLRPRELALDETPGIDPVLHLVETLQRDEGYEPDLVMLLQPTSPLRTAADIDAAVSLATSTGAEAVISVCPVAQHPAWMKRIGARGELLDPPGADVLAPRQQLAPLFILNGAIYVTATPALLRTRSFYAADTRAYVMPPERSLDVDTAWDMHLADLALRFPFRG
jgi:N-acylneuraminate cytidylyltransferase/CMP-N,N'-diacetyllegionaminic acid synthase